MIRVKRVLSIFSAGPRSILDNIERIKADLKTLLEDEYVGFNTAAIILCYLVEWAYPRIYIELSVEGPHDKPISEVLRSKILAKNHALSPDEQACLHEWKKRVELFLEDKFLALIFEQHFEFFVGQRPMLTSESHEVYDSPIIRYVLLTKKIYGIRSGLPGSFSKDDYDLLCVMSDLGWVDATYLKAYCFINKKFGLERNEAIIMESIALAAQAGHLRAGEELACFMYKNQSKDSPLSEEQEAHIFTIAKQGSSTGQFLMAMIYVSKFDALPEGDRKAQFDKIIQYFLLAGAQQYRYAWYYLAEFCESKHHDIISTFNYYVVALDALRRGSSDDESLRLIRLTTDAIEDLTNEAFHQILARINSTSFLSDSEIWRCVQNIYRLSPDFFPAWIIYHAMLELQDLNYYTTALQKNARIQKISIPETIDELLIKMKTIGDDKFKKINQDFFCSALRHSLYQTNVEYKGWITYIQGVRLEYQNNTSLMLKAYNEAAKFENVMAMYHLMRYNLLEKDDFDSAKFWCESITKKNSEITIIGFWIALLGFSTHHKLLGCDRTLFFLSSALHVRGDSELPILLNACKKYVNGRKDVDFIIRYVEGVLLTDRGGFENLNKAFVLYEEPFLPQFHLDSRHLSNNYQNLAKKYMTLFVEAEKTGSAEETYPFRNACLEKNLSCYEIAAKYNTEALPLSHRAKKELAEFHCQSVISYEHLIDSLKRLPDSEENSNIHFHYLEQIMARYERARELGDIKAHLSLARSTADTALFAYQAKHEPQTAQLLFQRAQTYFREFDRSLRLEETLSREEKETLVAMKEEAFKRFEEQKKSCRKSPKSEKRPPETRRAIVRQASEPVTEEAVMQDPSPRATESVIEISTVIAVDPILTSGEGEWHIRGGGERTPPFTDSSREKSDESVPEMGMDPKELRIRQLSVELHQTIRRNSELIGRLHNTNAELAHHIEKSTQKEAVQERYLNDARKDILRLNDEILALEEQLRQSKLKSKSVQSTPPVPSFFRSPAAASERAAVIVLPPTAHRTDPISLDALQASYQRSIKKLEEKIRENQSTIDALTKATHRLQRQPIRYVRVPQFIQVPAPATTVGMPVVFPTYNEETKRFCMNEVPLDEAGFRNIVISLYKNLDQHPLNYYHLGFCFMNGNGVVRDEEFALYSFEVAAAHGYKIPDEYLSYLKGKIEDKSLSTTITHTGEKIMVASLYKNLYQRTPLHYFHLGLCFMNGTGVTHDYEFALHSFEAAAARGCEAAREHIPQVLRKIEEDKAFVLSQEVTEAAGDCSI